MSEAEQAELDEFLENIKLLTATLGHKIFENIRETLETEGNENIKLFCRSNAGANAEGSPSTEGFIVFKDSLFIKDYQQSLTESIRNERNKMLIDGILTDKGDIFVLNKPYTFTSSSRAAAMILGRSASGPVEWVNEKGVSLKKIESK